MFVTDEMNGRALIQFYGPGWFSLNSVTQEILADDMRAALTAALASMWRPIEEAPRDAYELILGCSDDVGVGFWHDGSECYGHRGGEGWFSSDDRNNLLTARNFPATHFMPLPAPPVQQKEGV